MSTSNAIFMHTGAAWRHTAWQVYQDMTCPNILMLRSVAYFTYSLKYFRTLFILLHAELKFEFHFTVRHLNNPRISSSTSNTRIVLIKF